MEILAPAGDEDALRAAVFAGADAVYLGLTSFSARRSAGNFTPEQLERAVPFCHARGVRVYVAVNTTVYEDELSSLADAIRTVARAGADAVIVQDLAAAALARQMAPGLAIHGSTQMSVHSPAGAMQLARMGFSRVILARELSLEEIRRITESCPIEVECFVHGALCMSVSGQCYMSAFLGGRSGNRGSCAGTCRLPFGANGEKGFHLSLKDLSAVEDLPDLAAAGVCSAKIEGRLRPPEYVAAAVDACLAAREGRAYDAQLLRDVFSRSGFTNGYLEGKINGGMFGVRTAEDTAAGKKALPQVRELYRRERQRVPVNATVTCEEEGVKLTLRDEEGNTTIGYSMEAPQPAEKDQKPAIERALGKMGGTPFLLKSLEFAGQQPGFLPGSQWNELRREALEKLLQKREQPRPIPCAAPALEPGRPHPGTRKPALQARFQHWEQVPQQPELLKKLHSIVVPIGEAAKVPAALRGRTLLELPRVMFGGLEQATRKALEQIKDQGFMGVVAHNIAHILLAQGLPIYGGFGLNVTNPLSAKEYAALGLRGITVLPEVEASRLAAIDPGVPTAALIYGHMPLMLTRACPLQNVTDCDHCKAKGGTLTDRMSREFPVDCGLGVRTIYNPVPLYMGDKPMALAVDVGTAYFTGESAQRCAQILELLQKGSAFDGEFTRGLYFKGTA